MIHRQLVLALGLVASATSLFAADTVFQEAGGIVAVEAEHFFKQTETDKRKFYLTTQDEAPETKPDGDPPHVAGASGGAYLEILPDTRRTHQDKLIKGTNFSAEAGKMAVLHYKVNFTTPGKYYVWVRAHSTGSEDNGLHVGIDGTWPESGQRLQWCAGKKQWFWESKQRTKEEHCGEPHKIFLEITEPGEHTIMFSMREDGFEFDKWLMTTERQFARPSDIGPDPIVASGPVPKTYPFVAAKPVPIQPQTPVAAAAPNQKPAAKSMVIAASEFTLGGTGFYLDKGKWAAIHPEKNKTAKVGKTVPLPTGKYDITLHAVGESDGQSTYVVSVDDNEIGSHRCPLSTQMYEDAPKFRKTFKNIDVTDGSIISVASTIASKDGDEYSRARWAGVEFTPADAETARAARPFLVAAKSAKKASGNGPAKAGVTVPLSDLPVILPRGKDGDGTLVINGEPRQWHRMSVDVTGPYAHEQDNSPNPFTDLAMNVTFKHSDGTSYTVPGYFAADGNAANSSAESGNVWRANFAPDRPGKWDFTVSFKKGPMAALDAGVQAEAFSPFDGGTGTFNVKPTNKKGRDLRAHGRLAYVGKPYLQFIGSGEYFLKAGADAPETLLGYADFDNTIAGKPGKVPLKTWTPHVGDWRGRDPNWKGGKGKGLIGAINYLSAKGCNAFSFLTYNAGGDGDNVWPFIDRGDKMHYDCSKLDQWGIVFDHGTAKGMYLHFKMQETENDDAKPESLDGGDLGPQRKLYCRELIARFGHNLALNWNLGEENTQTTEQQQAMINYIADLDAYDHNIVLHTFPNDQDKKYRPLLGQKSKLTGLSLQNSSIADTHWQTVKWSRASAEAGKPWIVAFDESGSAAHAQCPDIGYQGFDGRDNSGKMTYTPNEVRKQTLWGNLMGGGAGVEYYFGYKFVENDLVCEDWRSRDRSWDYCRIAINFFPDNDIPFWEMKPADELVGNPEFKNTVYCLAKTDSTYVVYLADGGTATLDLSDAKGDFDVSWFNPRVGSDVVAGSVAKVAGGGKVDIGTPPADADQDWVAIVRKSQ